MSNAVDSLLPQEAHNESKNCGQLAVHCDQLMTDILTLEIEKKEAMQPHEIHSAPWQASHALNSEYVTVLQ